MSIDLLFQDVSDLLGSLAQPETARGDLLTTLLSPAATVTPAERSTSGCPSQWQGDADPHLRQIDDVLQLLSDDSLVF